MNSISVIIPTYRRPEMLRQAIRSVIEQTLQPLEIIVGDDGAEKEGKAIVADLQHQTAITIRYIHHNPPRGQAGNVDKLIREAKGNYISLLHDDDWFLPNALHDLATCFQKHPELAAAYGKQLIASHEGRINTKGSDELNSTYHRIEANEGQQPDALAAAIIQQFPNNGWLVKSILAKNISYANLEKEFGHAVDFGFGIKLAQLQAGGFYFINKTTTIYRLSNISIARNPNDNAAYYAFKSIYNSDKTNKENPKIKNWMQSQVKVAILQALIHGTKKEAKEWLWSKYHRSSLLTPGGIKRLLKVYLGESNK